MTEAHRALAIIGVPWSADELAVAIAAAGRLGARVLLVDTPSNLAAVPTLAGCQPVPVPAREPGLIAEAIRGHSPAQVVAITELEMICAARTRELLGLPGTSAETEAAVIDKARTRALLAAAGLTRVEFRLATVQTLVADLAGMPRPVIVKPSSFTGSHGVQLVDLTDDPAAVLDRLLACYDVPTAHRHGRDELVIESLIPGPEYSAEAVVVDGKACLLALTDKITLNPPAFFEVGHIMPSRRSAEHGALVAEYLQALADTLHIATSALHAELKIRPDGVELIELHTRFGGGTIVRLLAESLGIDAYQLLFAGVLDGQLPEDVITLPSTYRGVAFFGARPDRSLRWPTFDFPHPAPIISIDFDAGRSPAVREHEGIRLQHWRAGAVRLAGDYDEVRANIEFVKSIVQRLY